MSDSKDMFGVCACNLARQANPGSSGWSAATAFGGRFFGSIAGNWLAAMVFEDTLLDLLPTPDEQSAYESGEMTPEEEKAYVKRLVQYVGIIYAGGLVVGAGLGAAGAAVAAPEGARGGAALGAAIGGIFPIMGSPLAALGAYVGANRSQRAQNPMSTGAKVGLSVLGVAAVGGLGYAALRMEKAKAEKAIQGA